MIIEFKQPNETGKYDHLSGLPLIHAILKDLHAKNKDTYAWFRAQEAQ